MTKCHGLGLTCVTESEPPDIWPEYSRSNDFSIDLQLYNIELISIVTCGAVTEACKTMLYRQRHADNRMLCRTKGAPTKQWAACETEILHTLNEMRLLLNYKRDTVKYSTSTKTY